MTKLTKVHTTLKTALTPICHLVSANASVNLQALLFLYKVKLIHIEDPKDDYTLFWFSMTLGLRNGHRNASTNAMMRKAATNKELRDIKETAPRLMV